jgi:hypothetical protein
MSIEEKPIRKYITINNIRKHVVLFHTLNIKNHVKKNIWHIKIDLSVKRNQM